MMPEQDIPLLDDADELALDCETVEDYCARFRSIAEQSEE